MKYRPHKIGNLGYNCVCFYLLANLPEPYLIFAHLDAISRVNLDESNFHVVVSSPQVQDIIALDVDIRWLTYPNLLMHQFDVSVCQSVCFSELCFTATS